MKSSILHIIIIGLLFIGIASSCNKTAELSHHTYIGQLPIFADSLQSQIKGIDQISTIQNDSIDITKPLVMKGWFYLEDITSKSHTIFGAKDLFLLNTTSNGGLHFNQPEINDIYIDSLSISPYEWNHYAVKINRPSVEIYLNGKIIANINWTDSSKTKQQIQPIIIGWQGWNDTSKGYIYDFIARNKPAQEINSLKFSTEYEHIAKKLPLTANLIFFHTFDNKDSYWQVNHKPIHYGEMPNFAIDNQRNSYAHFDSTSSFHIVTDEIYKSLTIACKIKQDAFYRDYGALVSIGEYIALRTSNNGMYATIPQVRDFYTSKANFQKNEWVHLTMTYVEKVGVTYYINGKKCDFLAETRTLQAFKDILVGRNVWNNKLIADIDNIFIWNRSLQENEIALIATMHEDEISSKIRSTNTKHHNSNKMIGVGILSIAAFGFIYIAKRRRNKSQQFRKDGIKQMEALTPSNSSHKPSPTENSSILFKEKLDEIIMANLSSSDFQIKELATEMGVSRTVLYNQCAECLHESPKQYIRNIRLDQAKKLLIETNKPIVQIMDETGFESRAYFAKCIKERFGVTPAALRQIP